MVDELIYSELAKSFADNLTFAVRGVSTSGYGVLYPMLIAPAYAVFDRVPDAYAAIKTINSLVMSLAAIPAYFLARRVVGQSLSLVAAVIAVAVPSMVYTAVVMTENAFYPVFLLATLALVALLERPTTARYVGFFAALGLAYLTRSQAIVIALAAVTAPLLLASWTYGRFRATFRQYVWLYAVFAGGAVLGVVAQVARGRPLSSLLGAYAVVGQSGYDLGRVLHFIVYHLAELDLYVGVIPFAVAIVLSVGARTLDRPLQLLLAVTLALVGVERRGRRNLRLALRRPDPGAQYLRRCAAPARSRPSVGGAGCSTAARGVDRLGGRGNAAHPRDSVRSIHHDVRCVRHARVAAVVGVRDQDRSGAHRTPRALWRGCVCPHVPARASTLRTPAAGRRSRLLVRDC